MAIAHDAHDEVESTASSNDRVRMTGHERRAQLIAVGRALFAEKPFESVPVEEIAQVPGPPLLRVKMVSKALSVNRSSLLVARHIRIIKR